MITPITRPDYPIKPPDEHDIAWTEQTWNPLHGCTKCSLGCLNCYACGMARRQQGMGNRGYENGFELTLRPERLPEPGRWRSPTLAFVVSMGDLFHPDVPDVYILKVVDEMRRQPRHRFQVLTKRAERLAAMQINWPSNVWVGVSVEHHNYRHRVDCLRSVDAAVRWLSIEPLLSSLQGIDLTGIDWAVVGGESGSAARPMEADWVRELRDICLARNTAFFFKQWGGRHKKKSGRILDGRTWDEMPLAYASWLSVPPKASCDGKACDDHKVDLEQEQGNNGGPLGTASGTHTP